MSLFGRPDTHGTVKPKPHAGVVDHLVQLITSGARQSALLAEPAHHHPLDPLSPDEISQASTICKQYGSKKQLPPLRFNAITLQVITRVRHILLCSA